MVLIILTLMSASPRGPAVAPAFAWCGAAAFAGSLLFFLYSYLITFGRPAESTGLIEAVAIDWVLFTAFALHHSVFARPAVKNRLAARLSAPLERSVYTWVASLLFVVVCAGWRAVPGQLYQLSGLAAVAGYAVQLLAIVLTARSSARLDVLDLAGVRPFVSSRTGASEHVPLVTTGLYGFVRHPLYFAWMLLVFAAPRMTMTRLTFAVLSTAYLAIAIPFEERALVRVFGAQYREYQRRVRWRMIPGVY
jgi:protein-S-isoprenylcysteine O-methyltransferase Ste14